MAKTTIHSDYIPDNAITSTKIAENSIGAREIATNAITTLYVADGSVSSEKLASNIDIAGTFDVTGATTLDAGLTVDTSTLVVDATNDRVGIGTSSPDGKLDAAQAMTNGSTGTFTSPHLALTATNTTDTTGFVGMTMATSDNANYGFSYGALRSSGGLGDLIWKNHYNSADGTELLRLTYNGKVGIGTNNPPSPLSIFGAGVSSPTASTAQESYDNALFRINNFSNSSVGLSIGSTGSNVTHIQTSYNEGTTSPLTLNPFGGNVGIGAINPDSKLHILGTGNANIKITAGADSSASLRLVNDAHDWDVNCQTNDNFAIYSHTDSTERLIINPSTEITLKPNNGTVIVDGGTGDYEPAKVELQGRAFGGDITAKYEVSDGGAVFFGSTTNHDVRFIRNSAEKLTIDAQVNVKGAKTLLSGTLANMLNVIDTTSAASGVGGGIQFMGAYTGSTVTTFASIEGIKANATGGNYAGHLIIKTRDGGGNNLERLRLYSDDGAGGYGRMKLTSSWGSMTIGASNSSYHHFINDTGPGTFYFSSRCEASGGFHTYSDERLKENITPITNALDKVSQMNGITFSWIDAENRGGGDTGKQFGVTAQNMLEVDNELPTLNKDPLASQDEIDNEESTDYYSMDYNRITPFLIEAIKELKTELDAAKARITELEG